MSVIDSRRLFEQRAAQAELQRLVDTGQANYDDLLVRVREYLLRQEAVVKPQPLREVAHDVNS